MNDDLEKISMWAYQWKMSFNPDISKQAKKITFFQPNNVSMNSKLESVQ